MRFDDLDGLKERIDEVVDRGPTKDNFKALWELLDTTLDTPVVKSAVEYAKQRLSDWPYEVCAPPWMEDLDADFEADSFWSREAHSKCRWKLVRYFYPQRVSSLGLTSMQYVSTAMASTELEGLRLYFSPFSTTGFKHFLESDLSGLRKLVIAFCKLTASQVRQLLRKLPTDGRLEHLCLNGNKLSATNIKAICGAEHFRNLRELHLTDCGMNDDNARLIASSLPQLEHISIASRKITDADVVALVEASLGRLALHALSSFDKDDNGTFTRSANASTGQAAAPSMAGEIRQALEGTPSEEGWAQLWELFETEPSDEDLQLAQTLLETWPDTMRVQLGTEKFRTTEEWLIASGKKRRASGTSELADPSARWAV